MEMCDVWTVATSVGTCDRRLAECSRSRANECEGVAKFVELFGFVGFNNR